MSGHLVMKIILVSPNDNFMLTDGTMELLHTLWGYLNINTSNVNSNRIRKTILYIIIEIGNINEKVSSS